MISNEKIQNYKIVDLVESYNFRIKIISIRVRMKKIWFFLKSDLVTLAGCLSRRWEWCDKVDTWNMNWQTPSERSEACQRGTSLSRQCMWRDSVFLSRHADQRDQNS